MKKKTKSRPDFIIQWQSECNIQLRCPVTIKCNPRKSIYKLYDNSTISTKCMVLFNHEKLNQFEHKPAKGEAGWAMLCVGKCTKIQKQQKKVFKAPLVGVFIRSVIHLPDRWTIV